MGKFKIYDGRTSFYQWDRDQRIVVLDESCDEVHIAHVDDNRALCCAIYELDGKRVINVPDELLQVDKPLRVFCYIIDNKGGRTTRSEIFAVLTKPKPDDYVYTKTEARTWEKLDERVGKLVDEAIEITVNRSEGLGDNSLKQDAWRALPEGEIVSSDNGIIVVSHNEYYGNYLEQIKESTITPHVGYYVDDALSVLTDEVPSEAKYLTDAYYATASDVKGSADLDYSVSEGHYVFDKGKIPAAVLDLSQPTLIGAVELTCRLSNHSPIWFGIEVKDLTGEWITVKEVNGGGVFMSRTTEKYTFDPVVGTNVRVLILSCHDAYPKILEIAVYEVKSGRILEKITPTSVSTDTNVSSGSVTSIIDGDKNTNYQTFNFYPKSFTFNFAENTTINRLKVCAYHNQKNTPRKIILEAMVDGEWVDVIGSTKPTGDKNYESVLIYEAGLTDTCVLDFDKDYIVSAIRLYVTSPIGENLLVLNEVEFYGPAKSTTNENAIGVVYDEYSTDFDQKAGDVWYFGSKVSCENYIPENTEIGRPVVSLEADVSGVHKELCSSVSIAESLEDYYCTFTIPEDYSGSFTNLLVKAQYPNAESVDGKTCKFSDFVLVNLTETYGAGNEPCADDYFKALRTSTMTIASKDGVQKFSLSDGLRGPMGKSAYEYAVEGGYIGTEEEFAEQFSKENGDSWELIADITTTESVASVTITKDLNGNPFELKKLYIRSYAVSSNFSRNNLYLRLDGASSTSYHLYASGGLGEIPPASSAFYAECLGVGLIRGMAASRDNQAAAYMNTGNTNGIDRSSISAVCLYAINGGISSSSSFEVWGVRV